MPYGHRALRRNEPLAERTSFGTGGPAAFWYEAGVEELESVFHLAWQTGLSVFLLGGGTNVLVSDKGFEGIVVTLSDVPTLHIDDFQETHGFMEVTASAGYPWDGLVRQCTEGDLRGIECLSGIPGTVGAAPVQNIGAYGQQFSDVVVQVNAVDCADGRHVQLSSQECLFGYRTSMFQMARALVITSVKLRLSCSAPPLRTHPHVQAETGPDASVRDVRNAVMKVRDRKGMLSGKYKSAGSFFKNPMSQDGTRTPAGRLIEQAGFARGYTRNGKAAVSPDHPLALVNTGNASSGDIIALAREIQDGVARESGIILEPEVRLVGFAKYPLL